MRSIFRELLRMGHRLVPELLKRRLRQWYWRTVFLRLFPEAATHTEHRATKEQMDLSRVAPFLIGVGEYHRPTLVCLPIIAWDFRFQRPQQLLTRFAARGYRIVYLDPCLDGIPYQDAVSEVQRWTTTLSDNILSLKLPAAIHQDIYSGTLGEDAAEQLAADFSELALTLGVGEATLFVELPFWEPLARRLQRDLGWGLIYDCLDDLAGFDNISAEMLSREVALVRAADLVLASSAALEQKLHPHARRLLLAPNGCDVAHFAVTQGHPDLACLQRPIVGYFGAIADWFDADLVAEAARLRPEWSFVLVGRVSGEKKHALSGLANVHLLGEKDYVVLPQYLAGFDACLIPFRDLPLTRATNPVKLYEYFSVGKPVVATPLPEVMPYVGLVQCAATPQELVQSLSVALASGPDRAEQRRAVARASTWEARAESIAAAWRNSAPLASIVIVTWNNWEYTRACLDSILRFTTAGQFDVIVVDNASTDRTRLGLYGYQCQHPCVKVIYNDENRGFSAANNQGLRLARGEWLVLLNNDTVVTPGWLRGLGAHLQDPTVGLVGPVTNWVANEACMPTEYHDLSGLLRQATRVRRQGAGRSFDITMLAMYCVAMRRDVFERVGELDERFEVGMFEDDDYSLRIRLAGLRVVCAEGVFVHHFGKTSFGSLDPDHYREVFARNRQRFEAKWNTPWRPQTMRVAAA